MRVILSRKGFDAENGGIPSAIMPDGTMLSFPIPSYERYGFKDLQYDGTTYEKLLGQLSSKYFGSTCHIDPDLTDKFRVRTPKGWKPAFGQCGASDSFLANTAGIKKDDLFLFFGSFRMIEKDSRGHYSYVRKGDFPVGHEIHVVWGYLQVGGMLTEKEEIKKYRWHPHADERFYDGQRNTLYIPTETLTFNDNLPGCGVFDFDEKRILTLQGKTKGIWKDNPVYRPENIIGNRKNSAKKEGIYYSGIWQELPLRETKEAERWAKSLF